MSKPVAVLFVCMGNICRSPTAEGVFRHRVQAAGLAGQIEIDSAGTHAYHEGESPDGRAQATARERGLDLSDLKARAVAPDDYDHFDLIIAMDQQNFHSLSKRAPDHRLDDIYLMMDFAPGFSAREVPDPYYGGPKGFDTVFDMVEAAADGLVAFIRERYPNRLSGA